MSQDVAARVLTCCRTPAVPSYVAGPDNLVMDLDSFKFFGFFFFFFVRRLQGLGIWCLASTCGRI